MTRIILSKVLPLMLMLMTLLAGPYPAQYKKMVFANGCFWGSEKGAWRLPGVFTSACGYCAGFTPNPTYEEACSGKSGHTEVKCSGMQRSLSSLLVQRKIHHSGLQGSLILPRPRTIYLTRICQSRTVVSASQPLTPSRTHAITHLSLFCAIATQAVQVVFDPEKIAYTDILRWFWESHDPSQVCVCGSGRGRELTCGRCERSTEY